VLTYSAAGSCEVRATAAQTARYSQATTDVTFVVTLAAPAFTLSASSESKAQNTAISGYTISSTGGAIASYSISPSAPAGTSFNTSTGLLSGTPSSVQSATTYTITATNATSSASQTFSLTVTLAAPAFTLSASSESKAQNTAITGYTIGSTGGAIASYSISPSAPAGTSFNTSTGLLSGTPTTVQSATTYTITATNATSSASQTFSLTVTTPASCANGGVCALGNTGPGGGKVFYVAPTTFTCGANLELTCKYLEASPIAYNSEILVKSATSAMACYAYNSTTGTSN
jgi:LysM repeat protein